MEESRNSEERVLQPAITYHTEEDISGEWSAGFTIGVQTFSLKPNGDKEHAEWYVKQLKTAFKNLLLKEQLPLSEKQEPQPKNDLVRMVREEAYMKLDAENNEVLAKLEEAENEIKKLKENGVKSAEDYDFNKYKEDFCRWFHREYNEQNPIPDKIIRYFLENTNAGTQKQFEDFAAFIFQWIKNNDLHEGMEISMRDLFIEWSTSKL